MHYFYECWMQIQVALEFLCCLQTRSLLNIACRVSDGYGVYWECENQGGGSAHTAIWHNITASELVPRQIPFLAHSKICFVT